MHVDGVVVPFEILHACDITKSYARLSLCLAIHYIKCH